MIKFKCRNREQYKALTEVLYIKINPLIDYVIHTKWRECIFTLAKQRSIILELHDISMQ
jgi:hypothetical protein